MEKNVTNFIDLARTGSHQWWIYPLGCVLILTGWVGAYGLSEFILTQARVHSAIFNTIYWYIYWLTYQVNFGMLFLVISVFVVVRVLHKRSIRSILTANSRLGWKNLARGFGLYFFFFLIAAALTEYLIVDSAFRIKLPQVSPVATIVKFGGIIVSALAEEVFNRGYILQALALLTRNRILLASASGFFFMAAHLPLVESNNMLFLLACFEMGFYLTIVTLKSNGLELAIGMHIAHNFAVTLVPHITSYQPLYLTIFFPICAVIMYLVLFRRTAMSYPETEGPKTAPRSFHLSSE